MLTLMLLERNNKETNKLDLMPTDSALSQVAEMTVTGVSGEDYVLRCVEKEDFDTKVTISSMKQAVKDVEIINRKPNN